MEESPGLDALRKIGKNAVPLLEEELKDARPNNRYKAAWALGQMGDVASIATSSLIRAMQDDNNSVRYYAIQSLMSITDQSLA